MASSKKIHAVKAVQHHTKNIIKRGVQTKHPKLVAFTLFIILFASVGAYLYMTSRAAGAGIMSITPSSQSVKLNSTLTITIQENSLAELVNAVQADLTYDQTKLQFVSINVTGSAFDLKAQNTGGNGVVNIAQGSSVSLSGLKTIATVTFNTIAAGTAAIGIASTSAIVRTSDTTNILGTMNGGSFTIDGTAPTVPTGLTATSASISSVALSWTASTDSVGVAGYNIYRAGVLVGTSTTTNFTNTGLTLGTAYSYTVAAYDAAGNVSAQTAAVSCTVVDNTAPSVPTGLSASAASSTSINLTWNASTDNVAVTGYKIYRGGVQVGTSAINNYTNTGLTLGTAYSYTVAAYDAAGNVSAQTAAVSYTITDSTAPSIPTGINITSRTPTSIVFGWTASTDNIGVTGYKVYRGGVQIGTSTTTSYSDSGLTMASSYSYTVAAYDAAGNTSTQSVASLLATVSKKGDVNGDNLVNVADLSILAGNYTKSGLTWGQGDIYWPSNIPDGVVNIYDLSVLAANWGL